MVGRGTGLAAALLIVALAVLWGHAASYLSFLADDALISLRYAARLLDGHGLTWSDGPRVEGYSNLLWVLLCAALGSFGIDLIHAVRALGFATAGLALPAVLHLHRPSGPAGPVPALTGMLAMALAAPLAVWTAGGLEQPLLACLLAWAVALTYPLVDPATSAGPAKWVLPGVLLGLLTWTRVDGILLAVGLTAGVALALGFSSEGFRRAIKLGIFPVLALLGQQSFRLSYYGEWVPNSGLAKVAFTGRRLLEGAQYVGSGLLWLAALAVPALVLAAIAGRQPERARRVRLMAAPLALWCLYVVAVGGDSFPAYRHLLPAVVLLALLLAEGLAALVERELRARRVAIGVALLLVILASMQALSPQVLRARKERWEWDGEVIGRLLARGFGERRPLLAADPAGTLPYFSGLPSIDMLGINDHFLARHRPADFGHGFLGHELGHGGYVLDRRPDLVVFCGPGGSARPCFRSGKEMFADPRFRQHYRPVTFEGGEPHEFRSLVWVRAEEGAIGIARKDGRVVVPGFLLSANPKSLARLGAGDAPGIDVLPDVPAVIRNLALDRGRFNVSVAHDGATPRIEVRAAGPGRLLARGLGSLALELTVDDPSAIDLLVAVGPGESSFVREVRIE